jgi:hypothetical protein
MSEPNDEKDEEEDNKEEVTVAARARDAVGMQSAQEAQRER